jgi:hypothetical protein
VPDVKTEMSMDSALGPVTAAPEGLSKMPEYEVQRSIILQQR